MSVTRTVFAAAAMSLATTGSAEMISTSPSPSTGFESLGVGSAVDAFSIGDIRVDVTTDGVRTNKVIYRDDRHGAVANSGDHFWKLRGGTTTLAFDRHLSALSFFYSDLENATLNFEFVDSTTGAAETRSLRDKNPNATTLFSHQSDSANGFDTLTISWNRSGDGVGFDDFSAVVAPAPGAAAALMLAGGLIGLRRR